MSRTSRPSQTARLLVGALRLLRSVLAVAGLGWALAAMPAERTLYKSVLPDGRVVYGDAPDPRRVGTRKSVSRSIRRTPPRPKPGCGRWR